MTCCESNYYLDVIPSLSCNCYSIKISPSMTIIVKYRPTIVAECKKRKVRLKDINSI